METSARDYYSTETAFKKLAKKIYEKYKTCGETCQFEGVKLGYINNNNINVSNNEETQCCNIV